MPCLICHGEDIPVTGVREARHLGPDVVYVPIQIPVYRTCGERDYARRTMRFLEEVAQQLQVGHGPLQEVGKILLYSTAPLPVGT